MSEKWVGRWALLLAVWLVGWLGLCGAAEPAPLIPEAEITALEQELGRGALANSRVEVRMACRSAARRAAELLEASPEAPNRFAVLGVMFAAQKRLLSLEATEENRTAIFETADKLLEAPDEYAELRLEADLLLSERELSVANATMKERAKALEELLARYRGTPAEWKSLMFGAMIATKLMDFDLEREIGDTFLERFGGDHAFIESRWETNWIRTEAVFSGRHKTPDGRTVVFPGDRLGHQYVAYFWSQNTPDIDKHLMALKEIQSRTPDELDVYSFNLDELPDAGEKRLRGLGLDWAALHLPGGRQSSTYRAYPRRDPEAIFVNARGHVRLAAVPKGVDAMAGKGLPDGALGGWTREFIRDDPRYVAQLQYLFNGDFLAGSPIDGVTLLIETLQSIQFCFTPPPFRYRLPREASLANYRRAEELCTAAIKSHPEVPGLWAVRNRRIIALLGMWRLGMDEQYLEEAVKEAERVLGMNPPGDADVVGRFCLATQALRGGGDPEMILAGLIEQSGGDNAPASALAAAAVLALAGNARTAHEEYAQRVQALGGDDEPALWSVRAFLRDRHHRFRNFRFSPGGHGYERPGLYEYRNMVSGLGDPEDRSLRLEVELKRTDGGIIRIPGVSNGEPLGVLFVEPPPTGSAQSNVMQQVKRFAGAYEEQGVKAVVVFLSEDATIVKQLLQDHDVGFLSGMLPGGLKNPLVQKLGILSADRVANPFLLRPDGTIAWSISGLEYIYFVNRGLPETITMVIGHNIAKLRFDPAFEALERGEFTKALQRFDGYTPPHWWTADRLHGRALAHMGLKDWNAALAEIDAALKDRLAQRPSIRCKCHGVVEMYLTKARILEMLGRWQIAAEQRRLAAQETLPHVKGNREFSNGVPVGVYYDRMKRIRLARWGGDE